MTDPLIFWVPGTPVPQGSHNAYVRGGRAVVVAVNEKALKSWREAVQERAEQALRDTPGFDTDAEGYALTTVFGIKRPKYHFRTNGELKPDAPDLAPKRPDDDKLLRAVGDALTYAEVWKDDSRVVERHSFKTYAHPDLGEGCFVILQPRSIRGRTAQLRGERPPGGV